MKRVPETLPEEVLQKMGAIDAQKQFAHIPFATIDDLPNYDALIVGYVILFCCLDCCVSPQITNYTCHHKLQITPLITNYVYQITKPQFTSQITLLITTSFPTRFGLMPAQMKAFWDSTVGLWTKGSLIGKVAAMFTSTGTQHGGQESTILGSLPLFLHHGMIFAGVPFSNTKLMGVEEMKGGTPYGASTIVGNDGSRQPSAVELETAVFQGKHVAGITRKLFAQ